MVLTVTGLKYPLDGFTSATRPTNPGTRQQQLKVYNNVIPFINCTTKPDYIAVYMPRLYRVRAERIYNKRRPTCRFPIAFSGFSPPRLSTSPERQFVRPPGPTTTADERNDLTSEIDLAAGNVVFGRLTRFPNIAINYLTVLLSFNIYNVHIINI